MVQKLSDVPRLTKKRYIFNKFVEFCRRTDLHGFKYIVMKDLNVVERSCWAVAVFFSMIVAVMFVITAYRWYARNPIITVIESTQGAIWDVTFPAITICDINAVSRRAARALSNNLTLPTHVTPEYVFKALRLVPLLFSGIGVKEKDMEKLLTLQEIMDNNRMTIKTLFKILSPTSSCDNLIKRCMWKNIIYRCDHLFQQVSMKIGSCCSFNYFAVDDINNWNMDTLRISNPRRVSSCGYQTALTVLMKIDVEDYYSTSIATHGVLVFIDSAYNIPDQDSPVRMVTPSTEVLIALSPERTYSTSGVKSFTPEQRQCYFHDEKLPIDANCKDFKILINSLSSNTSCNPAVSPAFVCGRISIANFKRYSFHNCKVYQRVLISQNECDCVPWFFPETDGYRICNFRDIGCMERFQERLLSKDNNRIPEYIQCLPECEHYDYPVEVAVGRLSANVPFNGMPFFENVDIENSSVLNIFFNDLVSTRYRRDVYLNLQNILAAFGGLLSLMLGFTLISAIDFVIFFTFRVLYDCTFGTIADEDSSQQKVINVGEKRNLKKFQKVGVQWKIDRY